MANEVEVRRLLVRLVGNMDSYVKMLSDASGLTNSRMKEIGKSVGQVGKNLTTKLTLPLAGFGVAAVAAFASFDNAMTQSTSIMDVNQQQIEAMRDTALELSKGGLAQGPKNLAESYFFLASAGKNAEQSMALIPKVAKFATAGAFDMALATDLLTDAQSALGMSSKDVAKDTENLSRVADVLVKANTLANASVQQFSEALTNDAAASLRSVNKEIEEGVAVLAAYADQGIKGQVAGSMLGRMTRLLTSAAIEEAAAYEKANVAVFDHNGEMRNYSDIIRDLEKHLKGMSTEQQTVALEQLGFTALVQKSILPLLGLSDQIGEYENKLKKAGGITEDVANKQMESLSNKIAVLKNQVTAISIGIGKSLVPTLESLMASAQKAADGWNNLSDSTRDYIVKAGLVAAALGPVLIGIGLFIKAATSMYGGIVLVSTSLASLGAALAGSNTLMAVIGGTVMSITPGIVALAVTFGALIKVVLDLRSAVADYNAELEKSNELNGTLIDSQAAKTDKLIKKSQELGKVEGSRLLIQNIKDTEKNMEALRVRMNQVSRELKNTGALSPFKQKELTQELKEVIDRLDSAENRSDKLKSSLRDLSKMQEPAAEVAKAAKEMPKPDTKEAEKAAKVFTDEEIKLALSQVKDGSNFDSLPPEMKAQLNAQYNLPQKGLPDKSSDTKSSKTDITNAILGNINTLLIEVKSLMETGDTPIVQGSVP